MKYKGLDIYDITLNSEDIGIKATSLVTLPAMESDFLHFNEDNAQFLFADEEKRELIGAIMIPNKPIFRNINGNQFYVNFTADVVRELTSKMIKSGTAGLFTIQHKFEVEDNGVDIQEIWIKETDNDKSVDFGIDEIIGTAFMKVKINSDVIWNQVKKSGLNGFSIELDASIIEKNELLFKKEDKKMSIKDVFENAIEVNGVQLHFNSSLGKNTYLVTESAEGKPLAYSGEFTHESVVYKVTDGVVTEFENVELSTKEGIVNLLTEFNGLKGVVEGILLSKEAIELKESELELLRTQFEADKSAFSELKQNGTPKVELNLSKQISGNGAVGKSWLAKFQ
jgi:hypothetical protein